MSKTITSIEGIGESYAEKLKKAGITTVEKLLEMGGEKTGRTMIAESSGISESMILDWVNMADLFRINGIAGQFAELLKATGVDTIKELALRNPMNLHQMLLETNQTKHLTRVVPSVEQLTTFINEAKTMDRKVFH